MSTFEIEKFDLLEQAIYLEVERPDKNWNKSIERAFEILGGDVNAVRYIENIQGAVFSQCHSNMEQSITPAEFRNSMNEIVRLAEELASLLAGLPGLAEFTFAGAISDVLADRKFQADEQTQEYEDLRDQLVRAKDENDSDLIRETIERMRSIASRLDTGISTRPPFEQTVEVLNLYRDGARKAAEQTNTQVGQPKKLERNSFVRELVKEYQNVFRRLPAHSDGTKFSLVASIFVEFAGYEASGLRHVIKKANDYLLDLENIENTFTHRKTHNNVVVKKWNVTSWSPPKSTS